MFLSVIVFNSFSQTTILVNNMGDPQGAGIGGRVVFVNGSTGELGSTDGTVAGNVFLPATTVVLAGENAARLGNKIIFVGFNAATGNELWISDGTLAGTMILKDINVSGSSEPQGGDEGFSIAGNTLYFTADDGINGRELWKTDGTTAGTVLVKDMNASDIIFATSLGNESIGNTLFFTAIIPGIGRELWKTDGTAAGTVMVKEIVSGPSSAGFSKYFVSNNTCLWFVANDGVNGNELWRTDGTAAGTFMLQNIASGDGISLFTGGANRDWSGFIFNDNLYFNPNGPGVSGNQLWKSDGTSVGTGMVVSLIPSGNGMNLWEAIIKENKFYFSANGPGGNELYGSDGTAGGTALVKDINPSGSSNIRMLLPRENLNNGYQHRPFRGKIIFFADDGTNGVELWASDGTTAGTAMIKNIHPAGSAFNTSGDIRYYFTHYQLFIVADNGSNGAELWQSDGTSAGTTMVQDLWTGPTASAVDIFGVAELNNKLVLRANNGDGADIYALNATVVPFPLSLTGFTAQLKNEQTELKWTTQQEVNFSHFNIQRSITGKEFISIAKVKGKGGTSVNNYVYTDEKLEKAGTYYYRLEMMDSDGKVAYSKIVSVKLKEGFSYHLVSTRNEVVISITGANAMAGIKLIDANGKTLLQQKQKLSGNDVIRIPVNHLASGIYIVTIECDGALKTERFIR